MKKTQRLFLLVAALLIAALMLCGCPKKGSSANSEGEEITLTFEIVLKDGSSEEHTLTTAKETLAEALDEAELIEYDEGGFYTTIGGVTVDWNVDESWWCITKDGETLNYGLNDIEIADGEHYEATYTIGY